MHPAHRTLIGGLAAGALLAAAPAAAPAAPGAKPRPAAAATKASRSYALPPQVVQPEGIATQGGRFYTGSRVNGTIAVGDVRTGATRILAPGGADGRTSALGLEVDGSTLWVAGGPTGRVFALDLRTGATKATFVLEGAGELFVNDLAVTRGGVYVTDSRRPFLYRIDRAAVRAGGTQAVQPAIAFAGTPLQYGDGNNLNGIEPVGDALVSVQSNTGQLWRIEPRTGAVREILVQGGPLTNGDGLLADRGDLLVVQNALRTIARVDLTARASSGRVVQRRTDPTLLYPTTIARSGDRLLLPNARFDQPAGTVPYTVASLPR